MTHYHQSNNIVYIRLQHILVIFRYDSRVKAMELDERPTEQYSDIGGLDKQIEEVQYVCLVLVVLLL